MCGIVGYIGNEKAYPILIEGLHKLEYRGYDSSGCALLCGNGDLNIYKAKGKVKELESLAEKNDCEGVVGIAHTRWATHGLPNETNAHPHLSNSGRLALVHNGIIENYGPLKENLINNGFIFHSETDTEVLVNQIEYCMNTNQCDLVEAVRIALKQVVGSYAICVIDKQKTNQLICARKSSPLVIGAGKDNCEFFIGSDAISIASHTKDMIYLKDEQVALCVKGSPLSVTDLNGKEVSHETKEVDLELSMLSKDDFPHFMLKEIFDQPKVLRQCMKERLYEKDGGIELDIDAVLENKEVFLKAKRFIIVSCGTSWHAGLIGKQLIEHFCKIPTEVAYASEFRYADTVITPDDVVIAISQSGETADTLAAIELAKEKGAFVYSLVNVMTSSIARVSDAATDIHVGPEIGVASTKAFTGQVCVLTMFALALGRECGTIDSEEFHEVLAEMLTIPEKISKILLQNEKIQRLAAVYTYAQNFLYLGRGYNYPVALEGALKMKEISYIHAEGYPAAEMKHGPIALVDSEMPVVFVATHHQLYQKILSNMQEVISRKGCILAIVTEGDKQVAEMVPNVIEVPPTKMYLAPLLSVIPLQLLSYHVAVSKGLDVDQPRNLAKSVTVE